MAVGTVFSNINISDILLKTHKLHLKQRLLLNVVTVCFAAIALVIVMAMFL